MKITRILYAIIAASVLAISAANASQNQFSATQVKALQQIIHNYIVQNPSVLVEASHALQQQQMQAAQKQASNAIQQNFNEIFNAAGKPVAGNKKGNITLVEFFDYQCPHCKVMGPIIDNLIKTNKNLKVIFAEWPIFGGNSQYASKAAIASMQQGKYYQFHKALTAKGYPLTRSDVLKIAKKVGLNTKKLQSDMKNPQIDKLLKADFILAQKIKIIGTPAFIIGNSNNKQFRYLDGQTDQETLQKLIDQIK